MSKEVADVEAERATVAAVTKIATAAAVTDALRGRHQTLSRFKQTAGIVHNVDPAVLFGARQAQFAVVPVGADRAHAEAHGLPLSATEWTLADLDVAGTRPDAGAVGTVGAVPNSLKYAACFEDFPRVLTVQGVAVERLRRNVHLFDPNNITGTNTVETAVKLFADLPLPAGLVLAGSKDAPPAGTWVVESYGLGVPTAGTVQHWKTARGPCATFRIVVRVAGKVKPGNAGIGPVTVGFCNQVDNDEAHWADTVLAANHCGHMRLFRLGCEPEAVQDFYVGATVCWTADGPEVTAGINLPLRPQDADHMMASVGLSLCMHAANVVNYGRLYGVDLTVLRDFLDSGHVHQEAAAVGAEETAALCTAAYHERPDQRTVQLHGGFKPQ